MASQEPPPQQQSSTSGVELTTLFLSAVASAVAAYVVSKVWAPGTLIGAAMTPVIVALVKEGLRKPTEKVAEVATVPVRWTRTGSPSDAGVVPQEPTLTQPPPRDPAAPHVDLPPVVAAQHAPVAVYSTRARRLRWRLALITGLLGFAVCVIVYTVPELVAGKSIGRGSGHATTIFGGHSKHHHKSGTTSTSTTKTSTTSTTKTTKTDTTPSQTTTDDGDTVTAPREQTPTAAAPASTATPPTSATPQAQQAPSTAAPPSTTAPAG